MIPETLAATFPTLWKTLWYQSQAEMRNERKKLKKRKKKSEHIICPSDTDSRFLQMPWKLQFFLQFCEVPSMAL